MGAGIGSITLSCIILAIGLWEAFVGVKGQINVIELPGFHQMEFKNAGLYAGVYQHTGQGPMPVAALSKLDVRVLSKTNDEEIPVVVNTTGQTFSRLGQQGMLLFNFVIQNPGAYTLSGVFTGESPASALPVVLFSQSLQNIKPTLVVGGLFFVLFLGLGIMTLVKLNQWAPPLRGAPLPKEGRRQ